MTNVSKYIQHSFRLSVLPILKYYPILMNAIMVLIMVEYLNGEYNLAYLCDSVFGYSIAVNVLMLGLSYERKFCIWHRLLIVNMLFNSVLTTFDFFGINVNFAFFVLSVVTAFTLNLSIIMLYKHGWFRKK